MLKKINQIKKLSYKIRKLILDISYNCGEPSHIGGALSIVEVLSVIYSNFNIKIKKPVDRFILSKGHGFLALLAVLYCKGFIKTATISFGQPMPEKEMMRAQNEAANCDLMIAVGSSLVVYPAATINKPGIIKHIEGKRFIIGEPDGSRSERANIISDIFIKSGLKAPISKDIRSDIWLKLIGNSSFNPLSVITQNTLKEVLAEMPLKQLHM